MSIAICDYEGSRYRDEFWGQGRAYEDAAERLALRALLPARGRRLVDIGAGYGRLADLYAGYQEVYLLDYARSQLQQAQEHLGNRPGITYVLGDIYNLPFTDGFFDTVVTVRVLHHISHIPKAFAEIARILAPAGTYILEYANKRNLKAIWRFLLGRQPSPFSHQPWEFVPLNFNFHPAYIKENLEAAGFTLTQERAVSIFRLGLLKRHVHHRLLAAADGLLQVPLAGLKPTPSVFVKAKVRKPPASAPTTPWRCPICHQDLPPCPGGMAPDPNLALNCQHCGAQWPIRDGILDFKSPCTKT